uniref:NADH-ubiquinone oxidoreductase chain 6 n=1 Tax=Coendou insidiosus TaxID=190504 RepID=M9NWW2_9HYST|nr:NADH dehydrogenase subunit 6 [Coendou insidiosus]AFQ55801.1 NADH dehydrogenase subunit 6 [Coendou insidiosus]
MTLSIMFILSVLLVLGFIGLSVKPSPVYGGLALVMSGGVGCIVVLGYGGSFLGLMMFLIYLGGMMVVFGYTAAMATERYPETWISNMIIWGSLLMGIIMELLLLFWWVKYDYITPVGYHGMGEWVIHDEAGMDLFREDSIGVAAIYSYNYWLMVVAGWSLFVGIFIAIEITRGN